MRKLFNIFVVLFSLTAIFSCNTTSGVYFYCDEIVRNTYYEDNIVAFISPINSKLTGVYVYNNTDKIVFIDRGTSFLRTNKQIETIYKAISKLQGSLKYTSSGSNYLLPGGVISVTSAGSGTLNGDLISEKRIIPIAPRASQCVTAFSIPEYFMNNGIFTKTSTSGPYRVKANGKIVKMKHGTGAIYNADNSILKYEVSLRYSFSEDMTDCVDAHIGNYLKAWIVDNAQGLYDYDHANLPFAGKYRTDSLNYSLFSTMSTYGE